jgi:5-methylcytosine-specific restriction endonuclease McrA
MTFLKKILSIISKGAGYFLLSVNTVFFNQSFVKAEPIDIPTYSRSEWAHWLDEDDDCQDTRQEVLIGQSLVPVVFENDEECRVLKGLWTDPYTGFIYIYPSDLDIDHIIPLAYAHVAGGYLWDDAEKATFANDQSNLLAVSRGSNRSKGSRGPSEFQPATTFLNDYLNIWKKISIIYDLNLVIEDEIFIKNFR